MLADPPNNYSSNDLRTDIQEVYTKSGAPPLRALVARTTSIGQTISASSLSRFIRGEITPRWEHLATMLKALDTPADDKWRRRWALAWAAKTSDPIRPTESQPTGPVRIEPAMTARETTVRRLLNTAQSLAMVHHGDERPAVHVVLTDAHELWICDACGSLADPSTHKKWHNNLHQVLAEVLDTTDHRLKRPRRR